MPAIDYFECARCSHHAPAESAHAVCPRCTGPLLARYDMHSLKQGARREDVAARSAAASASLGIWRYASVLPDVEPVTLGEDGTPLLRSRRYPNLLIKQEGANSTGSFHARGFALAVAMAKHRGMRHLALAGGSEDAPTLAAYAAAAGLCAHIFMPRGAPFHDFVKANAYGAEVTLIDGTPLDCADALTEAMQASKEDAADPWLDLSNGSEPFRLEGMKILGYEIAEQLGWTSPAVILYPAADTAGMVAIQKAFEEMDQFGWITGTRPSLHAVHANTSSSDSKAIAGDWVKHIVSGDAILQSALDWAGQEGLLLSWEGAAAAAAYATLLAADTLTHADTVVLINPAASLEYTDQLAGILSLKQPTLLPASARVGGIITPI